MRRIFGRNRLARPWSGYCGFHGMMNCNVPAGINGSPAVWILAANPCQARRVGNGSVVRDSRQAGSGEAFPGLPAGARPPADRRRSRRRQDHASPRAGPLGVVPLPSAAVYQRYARSEEHTSELQSLRHLVCRLLLEKKKKKKKTHIQIKKTKTTKQTKTT